MQKQANLYPMEKECNICLSKLKYVVEYECNHKACIKCGTRLIKMYKNNKCSLCQQESKNFVIKDLFCDKNENVREKEFIFQNSVCKNVFMDFLLLKCKKCNLVLKNTYEMRKHYREEHSLVLCYECVDNKKQFWFEYVLYEVKEIKSHKTGKLNEPGFRGHVFCSFCNIYLYDEIIAKQHCNQTHVVCTICDILGIKHRYYNTFSDLEEHFKNAHYCCNNKYCINIKAYAFPYKTELFEHLLKFHKQIIKLNDILPSKSCNLPFFDPYYLNYKNRINTKTTNYSDIKINYNDNKTNQEDTQRDIPAYLDRKKIIEINKNQLTRKSIINKIVVSNQEDVIKIIENIISRNVSIKDGCEELKMLVDDKQVLKLIKEINFENVHFEMKEYYKVLEKSILFPKFTSKGVEDKSNSKNTKKSFGFKIIDLSKYKK